jgi:hypothetical protein
MAFFPGYFFDQAAFRSWFYGARAHKYPECSWYVPMIGGRTEEWIGQLSLNTTNITAADNHPSVKLLTPYPYNTGEITDSGGTTHNESANSTISFTDNATRTANFPRSLSQNLELVQTANGIAVDEGTVNSTLNLTHTAVGVRDIPVSANHSITFYSLGGRTFTANGSHNVVFYHLVTGFNHVDDRKPAGNTLNLTQEVFSSSNPNANNALNLTQNVSISFPEKLYVSHYIGFSSRTSTPHRSFIEQELSFSQLGSVPLPTQHVTHNISFTHVASISELTSTLNLTDSVSFGFALSASNDFDLEQTLHLESNFIRSINHDAGIGHALTWYEFSPCGDKQYNPFQGENTASSNITHPNNTLQDPQGSLSDKFSLYTPYLGVPTSKVTMRKPELDNRDRNAYTRVNHETRGGKLIVYSDPDWPHIRTLAVTIVGLTESKVDELQSFMQDTIGQIIGLTDWEGRLWKGYIKNPNEPATQDGRKMWTVTFEFEGEMLKVEQPAGSDGASMNLSHSVSAVIV